MAKAPKKKVFKTSLADSGSRMIVIVAVIGFVLAGVIAWSVLSIASPDPEPSQASRVPGNLDSTAGGNEDAEMTELLTEQDTRRADEASDSGASMIATLTALSQTDREPLPEPRVPAPARTRQAPSEQPAMKQVEPARTTPPKSQPQTQARQGSRDAQEVDSRLSNEIKNIMAAMALEGGASQVYQKSDQAEQGGATRQSSEDRQTAADAAVVAQDSADDGRPPLIPAGEVLYAVMETMADSDVPGPIKARVVSGPFKDAGLLGSFKRRDDQLQLDLETIILPNDRSQSIDAVAVNPNDSSIGLATYVNRHYVKRFGGLMLGGFIEGFGRAVAQSGQTSTVGPFGTVTTQNDDYDTEQQLAIAAGAGAAAAGSEFKELADTVPTVRVAPGTPIGVLFLGDVIQKASTK